MPGKGKGPQGTCTGCHENTPGSLGRNDGAEPAAPVSIKVPVCHTSHHQPRPRRPVSPFPMSDASSGGLTRDEMAALAQWVSRQQSAPATEELSEAPVSGTVPVGAGQAAVARIPVPGTSGLHVELSPRSYVPQGGSTSTLFIQDASGKRHLRLDYGYNKNTGRVDYHWNQKGTNAQFGIENHAPAGKGGQALYKGAKYLKYGGRVLLVVGVVVDGYSIVVAKNRKRQVAKVVAGWTGAWAGCKIVEAMGAAGGSVEPGGGTAVGGIGGGIGGYAGASWAAGELYDYVEETFFEPLPETAPVEAPKMGPPAPAPAQK